MADPITPSEAIQQLLAQGQKTPDLDPAVFSILMQLIEEGTITLGAGNVVKVPPDQIDGILRQYLMFVPEQRNIDGSIVREGGYSPMSQMLKDRHGTVKQVRLDEAKAKSDVDIAQQELKIARDRLTFDSGPDFQERVSRAEQDYQLALKQYQDSQVRWRSELQLGRDEMAQRAEQAGYDRDLQRELLDSRLDFEREVEARQASAQQQQFGLDFLKTATENPFAFAALRTLQEVGQQNAAQESYQQSQQTYQESQAKQLEAKGQLGTALTPSAPNEATAQRNVGTLLQAGTGQFAGADEQSLGNLAPLYGMGVNEFIQALTQGRSLQPLYNQANMQLGPAPQTPGARVANPMEQGLAGLGFTVPGQAAAGTASMGSFFTGGQPTLGGLGQQTPENLQYLNAILGYQGIAPGDILKASTAITPGTAGMQPRRRILPEEQFAGVR